MRELRVFHGMFEMAGQAFYAVKGLKQMGIKTTHMIWRSNYANFGYGVSLNIYRKKWYLYPYYLLKVAFYELKILREHNVFHFHTGSSLLLNYDLWLFKLLHKKVFAEFHGSELRDYADAEKVNPYILTQDFVSGLEKRKKKVEKICRYADGVILHDDELIPHLPANAKNIFVVPLRVDLKKFTPCYVPAEKEKICIVHAPSNRKIKGSGQVIEAIEALKKKYQIEFILVENKSQKEAKEIYEKADIIVDQLKIGIYGVFAIEGMALGKPVVTYILDDMQERLPEELPIVSANPDTIEDVLEQLILDGKRRRELGIAGRKYVENYHDCRKNARMLYEVYTGKIQPIKGREAFAHAAQMQK